MKKLMLLTIICLLSPTANAQQRPLENTARGEVQFGAVGYNFHHQYMPSIQIGIVAPAGKYVSLIPFVNVFTSLNSTTINTSLYNEYTYQTLGMRGGLNFRVSTNSRKSHAYIELQGSAGFMHQSGRITNELYDNPWEYLGGLNVGGNFIMPSGNYLGFYVGSALGYFSYKQYGYYGDIVRYHAGITYQAGF